MFLGCVLGQINGSTRARLGKLDHKQWQKSAFWFFLNASYCCIIEMFGKWPCAAAKWEQKKSLPD